MSTGISHGWQGGSIAVYGSDSLFKVEAVTGIGSLRPNPDGHSNQGGRDGGQKGAGFARVLETEVVKASESGDIQVRTTGYTRMGTPAIFYMDMREYTFK